MRNFTTPVVYSDSDGQREYHGTHLESGSKRTCGQADHA
jgi:hypothetical protein